MAEPTLTMLLLLKKGLLYFAGVIGALVSLRFVKMPIERAGLAGVVDRTLVWTGGFGCALFITPAIASHLQLDENGAIAVSFVLGLFGMSIIVQLFEQIRPIVDFVLKRIGLGGEK